MEEGQIRQSAFFGGGMGPIGASLYWCKKTGFFKAKDKVNLNLSLGGAGDNSIKAFICKNCKIVSIEY